ncbi:hypothetical protein B0H13DRAFT_2472534, partial [Mycena leptocephala]
KFAAVRCTVHQGLEQEASNSRPFYAHRHRRFHDCLSSCFEVGQRCASASSMSLLLFVFYLTKPTFLLTCFSSGFTSTLSHLYLAFACCSHRYPIIHLRRRMGAARQPPLAIAKPRGVCTRGPRNTKAEHRCLHRHRSPSMLVPLPTPHIQRSFLTDTPGFGPSNLTHAGSDIDAPAHSVPLVHTVMCTCTPTLDTTEAGTRALCGRRCGEGLTQAGSREVRARDGAHAERCVAGDGGRRTEPEDALVEVRDISTTVATSSILSRSPTLHASAVYQAQESLLARASGLLSLSHPPLIRIVPCAPGLRVSSALLNRGIACGRSRAEPSQNPEARLVACGLHFGKRAWVMVCEHLSKQGEGRRVEERVREGGAWWER